MSSYGRPGKQELERMSLRSKYERAHMLLKNIKMMYGMKYKININNTMSHLERIDLDVQKNIKALEEGETVPQITEDVLLEFERIQTILMMGQYDSST